MDATAAQQMYLQSLGTAQSRMNHVWEPATVLRRNKQMQELHSWLSRLPASMDKTVMTCTPADLLVFMESHWLAHHAGTELPDGRFVPSPSGVNSCLSHLSAGLELLGNVEVVR